MSQVILRSSPARKTAWGSFLLLRQPFPNRIQIIISFSHFFRRLGLILSEIWVVLAAHAIAAIEGMRNSCRTGPGPLLKFISSAAAKP
jgi:hypothetical protein